MLKSSATHSLRATWLSALALATLLIAAIVVVACGGAGSSSTGPGVATVNVMLSDPATCQAPSGPFSHVYVTITDVQANVSSSAGSGDSGWTDLTPGLSTAPLQIDLLSQADAHCFLADLGATQQLQPGTYQQIRLILAPNSATVTGNQCTGSANCVVLSSDSSIHTLQLSSEAQTGIKIPSGQIASGAFTIAAGETKDLDIDFSTCESIVQEGNGQFRLKPVLHAGEVTTTSTSINGKVLDAVTGNPVSGTVLVAAEQKDAANIDRVVMSTLAGSDGSFVFCPLPAGTYDIVIVGTRSDNVLYQPSIVTGVGVGSTVGNVNLNLPADTTMSAATLIGNITSQNSSMAATVIDAQISALETISSAVYTIPLAPTSLQSTATLAVETNVSGLCPAGTDCATYNLTLPSGGPYVGVWSASGITLAQSSPLASYAVDGLAFAQSSGGTPDCTPSEIQSQLYALVAPGPFNVSVQPLAFQQCQ